MSRLIAMGQCVSTSDAGTAAGQGLFTRQCPQ